MIESKLKKKIIIYIHDELYCVLPNVARVWIAFFSSQNKTNKFNQVYMF